MDARPVLAEVRRELFGLVIAVASRDLDGGLVAGMRVIWTLASLRRVLEIAAIAAQDRAELRDGAEQLSHRAMPWLAAALLPPRSDADYVRIIPRVLDAYARPMDALIANQLELEALDLDDVNLARCTLLGTSCKHSTARRANLALADCQKSRWSECDLTASTLSRTALNESSFADCELDEADLESCMFLFGAAHRCSFRRARLVNSSLDGAAFLDCDFSQASFDVTQLRSGGTLGTRFIRCDLRGTSWRNRDLNGASFVQCKLVGARGLRGVNTATGPVVIEADLSTDDDGSQRSARAPVKALPTSAPRALPPGGRGARRRKEPN